MNKRLLSDICHYTAYTLVLLGGIGTFLIGDLDVLIVIMRLFSVFLVFLVLYSLGTILDSLDILMKKQDSLLSNQQKAQFEQNIVSNSKSNLLRE